MPQPNYNHQPSSNRLGTKSRRARFNAGLFTVLVISVLLLAHLLSAHAHARAVQAEKVVTPPPSSQALSQMSNNVNAIINNNPDLDISASILELNNGARFNYGLTDAFEAASVAKLITATDFLHHVELGQDSLKETVNGQTADYELQQMIEVSDDNAWQAFNDKLGHPDLASYASSIGLTNYDPDANTLPANDIATLLAKLYKGQLLNQIYTKQLLAYMAVANYNDLIGGAIPAKVKFYHKAGVLDDHIHDAAIIDDGKQPIVLVIFTREDDDQDYATRAQLIQQITKTVLDSYQIR